MNSWRWPSSGSVQEKVAAFAAKALTAVLRAYQLGISPLLGQRCRFHPTCSRYALAAVRQHGPWRGSLLALRRLSRCHPWHPGGVDFVPAAADCGKTRED